MYWQRNSSASSSDVIVPPAPVGRKPPHPHPSLRPKSHADTRLEEPPQDRISRRQKSHPLPPSSSRLALEDDREDHRNDYIQHRSGVEASRVGLNNGRNSRRHS